MKKIIILLCFYTLNSFCQSGKVKYTFFAKGSTIESFLLFNKNESIYTLAIDRDVKKVNVKEDEENSEEGNGKIDLNINLYKDMPDAFGLYTDLQNNIIIDHKFLVKNLKATDYDTIYVKDKAKNINWELQEETKYISSFNCQKAIGQFRGRTYTVWFTFEIPVSAGPWKLNGLPGLILEASDSKNQFHFFAEKIELSSNNSLISKQKFLTQNYISPIQEREKTLSALNAIGEEISAKIRSSMPRGTNITSTKTTSSVVNENDQIEINFDDISKKE